MIIEFEGCKIEVEPKAEIKPGDTYLAKRNTGWKLLTCREHNENHGFINSVEYAYPYDTHECLKVISIDGEKI